MIFVRKIGLRLTATIAVLFPTMVLADSWFYFDPLRIEAEIRFDGHRRESEGVLEDQSYELEYRLLLRQEGHVVDPRIGRFSLLLEPLYRHGKQEIPGDVDDSGGSDLNYDIKLDVLDGAEWPVDAHIGAVRATQVNDVAFGSRWDTAVTDNSLLVNWKNDYFPIRFLISDGSYEETEERLDSGTIRRRDEDRRRYLISGRSSKLEASFESISVDDHIYGDQRDYQQNRGRINHMLRWGRESSLRSAISIFDRSGFNPFETVSLIETLDLRHTDSVTSRTQYRYFNQSTPNLLDDVTHDAGFEIQHELYDNLRSEAYVRGESRSSPLLNQDQYAIGAGTNYRKNQFFGVDIGAGLHAEWRITDRQSDGGSQDVINEPYRADYVIPIILRQRFVYPNSIIVAAANDGFVYSDGLDYEISLFSGQYTEIRILPNGQIRDGEALLISYRYELQPSTEFDTITTGYSLSLGYRGFRLYGIFSRRDNNQRSGEWEFLPPDEDLDRVGLEWNWYMPSLKTRLRVENNQRVTGDFVNETLLFAGSLVWQSSDELELSLSANKAYIDSRGLIVFDPRIGMDVQNREVISDYFTVETGITWRPRHNLAIRALLGYWRRTEENRPRVRSDIDRRHLSSKLIVTWYLRQLYLDFRYDYTSSDINGRDTLNNRLMMTARRTFR